MEQTARYEGQAERPALRPKRGPHPIRGGPDHLPPTVWRRAARRGAIGGCAVLAAALVGRLSIASPEAGFLAALGGLTVVVVGLGGPWALVLWRLVQPSLFEDRDVTTAAEALTAATDRPILAPRGGGVRPPRRWGNDGPWAPSPRRLERSRGGRRSAA